MSASRGPSLCAVFSRAPIEWRRPCVPRGGTHGASPILRGRGELVRLLLLSVGFPQRGSRAGTRLRRVPRSASNRVRTEPTACRGRPPPVRRCACATHGRKRLHATAAAHALLPI